MDVTQEKEEEEKEEEEKEEEQINSHTAREDYSHVEVVEVKFFSQLYTFFLLSNYPSSFFVILFVSFVLLLILRLLFLI